MQKNTKKILLTGGGTGGSVAPLLAVVDELRMKEAELLRLQSNRRSSASNAFFWLGAKNGPEKRMVKDAGIKFKPIFSGKFRRYFSLRNFIDPIFIFVGFFQAFFIILKWRPNLVMSAGSFVSVPVVWAAWLLRVPILIHQQDARPGLANKLMARFARIITVTFKKSLSDYGEKAVWTGNLIRQSLTDDPAMSLRSNVAGRRPRNIAQLKRGRQTTNDKFKLSKNLPVVLIIGGGTGALAINQLVEQSLDELIEFCQIIHITGKSKVPNYIPQYSAGINYKFFEFLNAGQMAQAYAAADVAVSRCGMGVLTELSYLAKPAILIPIPNSHQEENAEIFKEKKAAIVLDQKELTAGKLADNIKKLLDDKMLRDKLSNNISRVIKRGANKKIAEIINKIVS
ncbi:MAG: undecaprenyldiphospho-muramoylpentapeptide beta-N-acetylglucosaminyltransferase [Patescibacteria group bacterium]|nr:undecaprenyldiphospho-muramoylpentapeptide beta-N-acetylglucosaminyltransferase [Patescibacteria group bacterium]